MSLTYEHSNPEPETAKQGAEDKKKWAIQDEEEAEAKVNPFLENATVRGHVWYKLLDAPVLTLDVTV